MKAIWKGFLNFGLISIPINLYSASIERQLNFHLFHQKDKGRIRFAKICKKDKKEIPFEDIIKGYEYSKGKYVFLKDEDFEKANVHKTNSIDIIGFTNEEEIDSIFFDKPYFLTPDIKNQKPFCLLTKGLEKTKKVALAQFVLHSHEHLCIIKPHQNILVLNQLRYANEIKSFKDFKITFRKFSSKELNLVIKFITELTTKFNPKKYKDTYVQDLKKIITQKIKGKKIVPIGSKPTISKQAEIFTLLEKSLKQRKK